MKFVSAEVATWAVSAALIITLLIASAVSSFGRWLLRGRARLGVTASIVVTLLGMALGLFVVGLIWPRSSVWSAVSLLFGVGASVLSMAAYAAVAAHVQRPVPRSIDDVLRAGESDQVEFKSTARVNLHTGAKDDRMELIVAKTVSGFLNADGGILVIGVDDRGVPLGLDADLATMKAPDLDRYELWLRDLFTTTLGPNAAARVRVEFPTVTGPDEVARPVCRITAGTSPRPVYLRPGKAARPELWVRTGNSTRQLSVDEAAEYVAHRWPLGIGASIAAQFGATVRFSGSS